MLRDIWRVIRGDLSEAKFQLVVAERNRFHENWYKAAENLEFMRNKVDPFLRAAGRLLAKLDPMWLVPEDDAIRKRDSDAIADEVIAKLIAEAKAQRRGEMKE